MMKTLRFVWALPLLTQVAHAGHRYTLDERAPTSAITVVAAVTVPKQAAPLDGPASSQAAFPEQEAAPTSIERAVPAATEATETDSEAAVSTPTTQEQAAREPAPPARPSPAVAHAPLDLSQENEAWESRPERPKLQRMVWGLSMRFGGTFASEDLITAQYTDGSTETLSTGGGANIFLGTVVIPFKYDSHSLGFGFEGGWKFSSIGQGSDTDISFSRNAFMPRVQYGYALNPAIHWITSVGPQYETDVTLKASGGLVGSVQFENAWGYFGETGILLDVGFFGLDLTLRHTRIDYALPEGPSVSGNSFGIFCGIQLGLLKTENLSARRYASN